MNSLAQLDQFSISESGPTLTLRIGQGRVLGLYGPAGSGKSRFLRCLAGLERPGQGAVQVSGPILSAIAPPKNHRATPLQLVKAAAAHLGAQRVTDVLSALRLWDVRKIALGQLSPGQQAACSLLEPLAGPAGLMIIDQTLDTLDPWTIKGALDLIAARLRDGSALAVATNRTELARRMDTLVVLNQGQALFAGSYSELERRFPATEVEVESHDQPGVRAMTAPFEVQISEDEGTTRITAAEGQKLAARLLLEGYGNVKGIILKRPSAQELLERLVH